MRTDQYIGLNERARELVEGEQVHAYTEKITRIYPGGRIEELPGEKVFKSNVKCEKYSHFEGAFMNTFDLFQYTLPNGKVLKEYVQAEPWSSGPMFFIALMDEDGKPVPESLWSDDEINSF